jgi:ABC-2 type transport system ATP-binding protein
MTTTTPDVIRSEVARHGGSAISLRNVTKSFGAVRAVHGIDLDIRPGEIVAVLGPNGAGKTTTIDMILGLSQPTTGEVTVLGLQPRQAVARGLVSAVMQTGGLLKDLSVRETVAYVGSLFASTDPVEEVLERAGITGIADRKVGKCSGGEQQRLRFALALLPDPALLLLDEPTTGMDVEGRRAFWAAIRADAEKGRTVLFATHYLEEADQYADRIVLMRRGRIVADGTGAEIKALSSGRTVRATVQDADLDRIARIDGVDSVEERGDSLLVHARDTDAVARYLLTETTARDLEITARGIEEAFLTLTGDAPDGAPPSAGALRADPTGGAAEAQPVVPTTVNRSHLES